MRGFGKKVENLFTAIAFAEEAEFETVREILRYEERRRVLERISPQVRSRKELRTSSIKR